jgi:hypothetical protein
MFKGVKPGTYKIYIDNLRIRHADGKATSLWASGRDTRTARVQETDLFKNVTVKTVMAPDFGK